MVAVGMSCCGSGIAAVFPSLEIRNSLVIVYDHLEQIHPLQFRVENFLSSQSQLCRFGIDDSDVDRALQIGSLHSVLIMIMMSNVWEKKDFRSAVNARVAAPSPD